MPDSRSQLRPAQLASRLLTRSARIGDRPASRLAEYVHGRHGSAALPTHPRLMPLRDAGRPQVALAPAGGSAGESRPAPAPAIEGMTDFAARWLFGDGKVEGTPFTSGADVPREHVGQLPPFLSGRRQSAAPPEPEAARQPGPPLRGQVQEGQPVRLSPVPRAAAALSRSADTEAPNEPPAPPPGTTEQPAGTSLPTRATDSPISKPAARSAPNPAAPAPVRIELSRTAIEPPPRPDPVPIVRRPAPALEEPVVEVQAPAAPSPPSRWRAAVDRVVTALRPPSPPQRPEQPRASAPEAAMARAPVRQVDPAPPSVSPTYPAESTPGPPAADTRAAQRTHRPRGNRPRPLLRVQQPAAPPPETAIGDLGAERVAAPTAGQRLAHATGAELSREHESALETIEFGALARRPVTAPLPSPVASGVPVGRAPDVGPAGPPANAGAPEAAQPIAAAATASPSGGADVGASHAAASPDADDLYEHMVERLRRDLLFERERMGDLLGDLP